MTIGRVPQPDDAPVNAGGVDYLQIDDARRLVLAPKTSGTATRPILGTMTLEPGDTRPLINATWEDRDGPILPEDLPKFLSWGLQVRTGSAGLCASETALTVFDIPRTPGAFSESDGAAVDDWWVRAGDEGAIVVVIATVAS